MFEILKLLKGFEKKEFAAGQDIIASDDTSKALYVLLEGRVNVVKDDVIIRSLARPGTIIGEISPILDIPRTAKVTARKPCSCYVVNDLSALFKENVDVSLEITRLEFDRLMSLSDLLVRLKAQFIAAAGRVGLDLTAVPELKEYMAYWEKMQADASAKFPFILKNKIEEGQELTLNASDTLYEEGDWVGKFYALKKGTIRQSRQDGAFSFDESEPGTVLNMGYTIINSPSMTTATATKSTIIQVVEDVGHLFRTEHSTGFEILRQVAQRIVTFTDTFVQMKTKLLTIDQDISPEYKGKMKEIFGFLSVKEKNLQEAVLGR